MIVNYDCKPFIVQATGLKATAAAVAASLAKKVLNLSSLSFETNFFYIERSGPMFEDFLRP
jgi:hypothetical protein